MKVKSLVLMLRIFLCLFCLFSCPLAKALPDEDVLTLIFKTKNASCKGASDGTITLTVEGGTPPYTFKWSNGATTKDLTGVPAGTYSVTVTDVDGFSAKNKQPLVITEPATGIILTATGKNASCNAGNDGQAEATVTGGQPPYAFTWSNGATTQKITGVTPGTYTVTARDGTGCSAGASVVIPPAVAMEISVTGYNVSCYGGRDGRADLTIKGGTAPFKYSWSNGAATEDLTGLSVGNYKVTVTDGRGCTISGNANISQPLEFSAKTIVKQISCAGNNDAKIEVQPIGGTQPYVYVWSNGAKNNLVTNLGPGVYSVTVTDLNGCPAKASVSIPAPAAFTVNVKGTNPLCARDANGSAIAEIKGGRAPYSYQWSNNANTQEIIRQPAGEYTVTVTDSAGCKATGKVTLVNPSALTVNVKSSDVSCGALADGKIELNITGGTPPYNYKWSNGATTKDLVNLVAGDYTFTITDAYGCVASGPVNLKASPALSLRTQSKRPTCHGLNDGQAEVIVQGGTAPFTYTWSNGGNNTPSIQRLTAGTYNVSVSDARGCKATATVNLKAPAPLEATLNPQHIVCFDFKTGAININVSGGTPPYSYRWSNGASTKDLTALPAGKYSVAITDSAGCSLNKEATITQKEQIILKINSRNLACKDASNGSASVSVTGASQPYTFKWSNGETTPEIKGLKPGNYSVTVTDVNNCSTTAQTTITEGQSNLTATATPKNPTCSSTPDGKIDLNVNGGTPPYTFNWNNGAKTQNLTGVDAGDYAVSITDANGCATAANASLKRPTNISATATPKNPSCGTALDGKIDVTVTGGTQPFTFNWNNGIKTQNLDKIDAGDYTLTITDANGCAATAKASLKRPPAVTAAATPTNPSCSPTPDGKIDVSVNGGTQPFTFSWSNGAKTQNLDKIDAGDYTLTITDANGCSATTKATLKRPPTLKANTTPKNPTCSPTPDGKIDVSINGGTQPFTFNWSNGVKTQNLDKVDAGEYSLTVTDAQGCTATVTASLKRPATITATANGKNPSCGTALDGKIDVTITVGTQPFTFNWSNGVKTQNLDKVDAGDYTVTITDANNCTTKASASLKRPAALSATATPKNPTCSPTPDGKIDVNVNGGTQPFTFSWSNGVKTQNLDKVDAGDYTVTITDANNCTATAKASLKRPPALTATATPKNPTCSPTPDGKIDVSVNGGTQPLSFSWSNGSKTQNLEKVDAGDYTVTITDANNCTATAKASLKRPPAITATATGKNPACSGEIDGKVTLNVSGGTPPLSFSWNNGAKTQNLDKVDAGEYNVTITDANGCSATASASLKRPNSMSLATNTKNPSCGTALDGKIELVVNGGTAPFTYSWSNMVKTQNLDKIDAGDYTVTVTDANNCTAKASASLKRPPALKATATPKNPSCSPTPDGKVEVALSGGTQPFTFNWSNGIKTQNLDKVDAGDYTLTVTDANNCTATAKAALKRPPAVTATATGKNPACSGEIDGKVTLNVSGGTQPFTFNWNNGAKTQNLEKVDAGEYTVTITDANGCSATASASLKRPTNMTLTATGKNPSCGTALDGKVEVNISGGTQPFTFSWSNGAKTQNLDKIDAGDYTVTVNDANNCTAKASASLKRPPAITATATPKNPSCSPTPDGKIEVALNGGTQPFTFSWSNGTKTQNLDKVDAGDYTLTVTDANNCTATAKASLKRPPTVTATATAKTAGCGGEEKGTLEVNAQGGTPPLKYEWSNGATTTSVKDVAPGSYTVTVSDVNGCTATAKAEVTKISLLKLSLKEKHVCCAKAKDGAAEATITGGTPPYSFEWSNGAKTQSLSNIDGGTYRLKVTDANGCKADEQVIVLEPEAATIQVKGNATICQGESVTLEAPAGFKDYKWSNGTQSRELVVKESGTYSVQVTHPTTNCVCTLAGVKITVAAPPAAPKITEADDMLSTIKAKEYQWYQNSAPVSGATDPTFAPKQGGEFVVKIKDENGCTATSPPFKFAPKKVDNSIKAIVYPNPNNGSFSLTISNIRNSLEVTIIDPTSKVVYSRSIAAGAGEFDEAVDLNAKSAGKFLLRIKSGGETVEQSIIVK